MKTAAPFCYTNHLRIGIIKNDAPECIMTLGSKLPYEDLFFRSCSVLSEASVKASAHIAAEAASHAAAHHGLRYLRYLGAVYDDSAAV